jgi:hypothetical protein
VASPFLSHKRSTAAVYADLETHALAQAVAPTATPGGIVARTNASGYAFYALQNYGFDGRRRETYVAGPVGDPEAERKVLALRSEIRDAKGAVDSVRMLAREGYAIMDPREFAVVAALANRGLFTAGAALVGTHAFGAIVNKLGIRAATFGTEDIDLGRATRLALPAPLEGGLLGALRDSGIDFVAVPPLDPRDPSVTFKEKGRSRFTVDLLVPSKDSRYRVEFIPELECHATALPYFRYLVSETQPAIVMSRLGCAAVRVPLPERFALHKLLVAQLRTGRGEKSLKDLRQAAVLIAALGEQHPGALQSAYAMTPTSVRTRIRKSLAGIRDLVGEHGRGLEELNG